MAQLFLISKLERQRLAEEYEQAVKKLNDQLKEKSELELKAGAGDEGSDNFIGPLGHNLEKKIRAAAELVEQYSQ